jgi:hypothetical protein
VLEIWRPWAPDVRGLALDAKHFLADDRPQVTAAELLAFWADTRPPDASQGENATGVRLADDKAAA